MTALPARRRRRSLLMLLVTLVVLAIVPIVGYVGVRAILDSEGGRDATKDNLPVITFPATPTGLLMTTAGGRLTSTTVFVLDPSGLGGSLVSVPVSADFGLADDARQSLQGAYEASGAQGTVDAVESLLGITINVSAEQDPTALADMLGPLAPIPVELPGDVPAEGSSPAIAAGRAALTAAQAARVLTASPPADGTGLEASRRPNVEAVWAGVASAVGTGKPSADLVATDQPADFDQLAAHIFAGTTHSRGLTAQPLTAAQNPSGLDVEQLDRSEAVFVFASIAPGAMSSAAPGPTFRLVAPPGNDVAVKRTIDKLLFLGGNIVSIDTTASPQPNTVFLVPDDIVRSEAQSTDDIFGSFTFGTPTERIDGVEVTVILGTDYLSTAATT